VKKRCARREGFKSWRTFTPFVYPTNAEHEPNAEHRPIPQQQTTNMLLARFAPRLSSLVQRTTAQLPTATTLSPTLTLTTKRTIKTKSSAKKRFKVLGSGKIKRWKANKRHINSKRNRKHIRQLGDSKLLQGYQVDLGRRLLGLK